MLRKAVIFSKISRFIKWIHIPFLHSSLFFLHSVKVNRSDSPRDQQRFKMDDQRFSFWGKKIPTKPLGQVIILTRDKNLFPSVGNDVTALSKDVSCLILI